MTDNKGYASQGCGFLPLVGPQSYTNFSKWIFGNEETIGKYPLKMFYYGDKVGFGWKCTGLAGRKMGVLPLANSVLNYMMHHHSYMPTQHDIVTGMWKPNIAETTAKLTSGDFCTLAAAVHAGKELSGLGGKQAAYKKAAVAYGSLTKVGTYDGVKKGGLGKAC